MSEIKVWIAREGSQDGKSDKNIFLVTEKPKYEQSEGGYWVSDGIFINLNYSLKIDFPEIKNGEMRSAVITLSEGK